MDGAADDALEVELVLDCTDVVGEMVEEVTIELVDDDEELTELLDCEDEKVVEVVTPGRDARYTPTPAIIKITTTTRTAIVLESAILLLNCM